MEQIQLIPDLGGERRRRKHGEGPGDRVMPLNDRRISGSGAKESPEPLGAGPHVRRISQFNFVTLPRGGSFRCRSSIRSWQSRAIWSCIRAIVRHRSAISLLR
jgi:hypothetical protein